jgi:acyl carrier protein
MFSHFSAGMASAMPAAWCCGAIRPLPAAIAWHSPATDIKDRTMSERDETFAKVAGQIEPFNKKGVTLGEATTFAGDLEWDSLTVMDFVASIEDEFDIIITMNMQAEIETVGQLVDAVEKLRA